MKKVKLQDLSVKELIARFVDVGLAQDEALLYDELAKFSRLFEQMQEVVRELKRRPGDQRRALLDLYDHPNLQVRLKAAKNSLALAPEEGRRLLQAIADSREYPQAGEAGMSLDNLDLGIFKPT
jgi:ParB-like chromosome segregation protein Spo0J